MKKVLITGGSRGIGFAIAKKLCEAGYEVVITGRNKELLAEKAAEINAKGFVACDLSRGNASDEIYRTAVDILGNIDVLVNNAGMYVWSGIEKTTSQDIESLLKLNLQVPVELCKLVVPDMKTQKWGRIINIGSISGAVGEANASLYSASKAGLIGLTKALALELAEHGVTVNIVNPGWVKTDLSEPAFKEEDLEMIPQKRWIEPDEVADLVKYLVSEQAGGITGQAINLCCGLSLG